MSLMTDPNEKVRDKSSLEHPPKEEIAVEIACVYWS